MASEAEEKQITEKEVNELLESTNTDTFFIEIPRGKKSANFNHVATGTIGLYRLGASKGVVDEFVNWYCQRLHAKSSTAIHENAIAVVEEDVEKLLGQQVGFYTLLEHYQSLLEKVDGSVDELLNVEFTQLMTGMAGGAFHGLIHLGYGFSMGNPRLICEGLAYIHFVYTPLVLSYKTASIQLIGYGNKNILEILDQVKFDYQLRVFMMKYAQEEVMIGMASGKILSNFENRMIPLLRDKGDILTGYVHKIRIPNFRYDPSVDTSKQLPALFKWLMDSCLTVYLIAERRNDFFLLHGVTSTWALTQILSVMKNYDFVVQTVRAHICAILAAYLAQDSPALDRSLLKEQDVSDILWPDIKSRCLLMPPGTDEHIYKLVQVCYDMKELNTDPEMDDLYKRAAMMAMSHPLSFPSK